MATSGGTPQEAALKIVGEADDEAARTYVFRGEDHTLGNALRHVLMRQKAVEFCGYSVPHPSEPFVHVRLQTTGAPARDVLDDGLKQLTGTVTQLSSTIEGLCSKLGTNMRLLQACISARSRLIHACISADSCMHLGCTSAGHGGGGRVHRGEHHGVPRRRRAARE